MDDYLWAPMMPDNRMILDNLGLRINLASMESWEKYRPYRNWWQDDHIRARLRRLFWRIFKPTNYEYMRVRYEKYRFRVVQEYMNAVLEAGEETLQ